MTSTSLFKRFFVSILFFCFLVSYGLAILFLPLGTGIPNHKLTLFNVLCSSEWINDDSLQQTFPFHRAIDPTLFQNDLVTVMMTHYLTPVHYWLSYFVTLITQDPILTSHCIMLVQLIVSIIFLGGTVYLYTASIPPTIFSIIWLLHSSSIIDRLAGGLTRGWALPVLSAFLFFVAKRSFVGILTILSLGCLTHPVSTFLAATTYGFCLVFYFFTSIEKSEKSIAVKRLISYLVFAPFLIAIILYTTTPADNIGKMATLETARVMPEFQKPDGRFSFLPFQNPVSEILSVGFETFFNPWLPFKSSIVKGFSYLIIFVIVLLGFLSSARRWRFSFKNTILPFELYIYGCTCIIVYLLSRLLAFRLYVPDRHLQIPLALFFIISCTVILWKLIDCLTKSVSGTEICIKQPEKHNSYILSSIALIGLSVFIFFNSGTGLFNMLGLGIPVNYYGRFNEWLRDNTSKDSVIAGDPSVINMVPLIAKRKAYITAETIHPFYDLYYKEAKLRYELSLKAEFAKNLDQFIKLTSGKEIDYFVFWKSEFSSEKVPLYGVYEPFKSMVKDIVQQNQNEFVIFKLINDNSKAIAYQDSSVLIVDLKKLDNLEK